MAVSLTKGGNVSLSKEAPGLTAVTVGLGWDARMTDGADFDLDASVFICGENGKVRSDADFIFYNSKIGLGGAVEHLGDNKTGAGEGDDEGVKIDLTRIPADVKKLVFAVTIHEAESHVVFLSVGVNSGPDQSGTDPASNSTAKVRVHRSERLRGRGPECDDPRAAHLVFTVNSFRGQTFKEVDNAVARLVDETSGREICSFTLKEQGSHTGVVMASLSKGTDGWSMKAHGTPATGRTVQDLVGISKSVI